MGFNSGFKGLKPAYLVYREQMSYTSQPISYIEQKS